MDGLFVERWSDLLVAECLVDLVAGFVDAVLDLVFGLFGRSPWVDSVLQVLAGLILALA